MYVRFVSISTYNRLLQNIKQSLLKEETSYSGWLIYFHIGSVTESEPVLKRLYMVMNNIKLGDIKFQYFSYTFIFSFLLYISFAYC